MSHSAKAFSIGLLLILATCIPVTASDALIGIWRTSSGEIEVEFFEQEGQLMSESSLFSGAEAVEALSSDQFKVSSESETLSFEVAEDQLILTTSTQQVYLGKVLAQSPSFATRGPVIPEAATRGMITGLPKGPAKSTASIFRVYLYDLDDQSRLIGSQRLDQDHGFLFENLSPGHYRVYFAAQGPTAIQPQPAYKDLTVVSGLITEQNVSLD